METDLIVVGSGAGGKTAAITARKAGLDVVVVEASEYFAGRRRSREDDLVPGQPLSGGGGNRRYPTHVMPYLQALIGHRIRPEILTAFLDNRPRMLNRATITSGGKR